MNCPTRVLPHTCRRRPSAGVQCFPITDSTPCTKPHFRDSDAAVVETIGPEAAHNSFAQMIARIHTSVVPVRRMIHGLLIRIGRHHPQARLCL